MKILILLCICAFAVEAASGPVYFRQSVFDLNREGVDRWTPWSPRAEIAPRTFVDTTRDRSQGGSLAISGASNAAEYGGWHRTIQGIEKDKWYRFTAHYQAEGVPSENWQVIARLEWQTRDGKRVGKPDYASRITRDDEWIGLTLESRPPEKAASVTLQLYLLSAPLGTVWWDDISFEQIPAPEPRKVTIASIHLRPRNTATSAETVRQFVATIYRVVPGHTDLIVLPEGVPVHGTGKTYVEVAEPIPGPTVQQFTDVARRKRSYVAFGMYEREGAAVYNTAVLLDRSGNLAGKYRKVYVPHEELDVGISPGNEFPVFQTDFGRVGMMICYDAFFAEPARALTQNGAEVLLLPIWGGDDTLVAARAIETSVFLVSSGVAYPTFIMGPDGQKLVQTTERGSAAVAEIDLNQRYVHRTLGNRRNRTPRELR